MNELTGADFKSATADDNKKLFIETYGCQMNVADSEVKKNKTVSQKIETTPANDPEFTIHSAEEARKAIIWSEILNRKY